VESEVEGTKVFVNELFAVWPRRFEAALEPDAVLDTPEVAETEDDELCRVIVCWGVIELFEGSRGLCSIKPHIQYQRRLTRCMQAGQNFNSSELMQYSNGTR